MFNPWDFCIDLKKYKWGKINLESEYLNHFRGNLDSPILDPIFCNAWIQHIHKNKNIDYSYGGFLEDRERMWNGSYLKYGEKIHLGVDINIPFDTPITCPIKSKLREITYDNDQNQGWGGKIILESEIGFLIMGHLWGFDSWRRCRDIIKKGAIIGYVGSPLYNGGWFEHIHVQLCQNLELAKTCDGYSGYYDGIEKDFTNPILSGEV